LDQPAQLSKTTARLGTDPLGKLLFRLSLPSTVSMIAISLYNLVNAFWVAKLGNQALAAITILMPFWFISVSVGAGTGVGANALASRRFGERKVEEANQIAGQTIFITMALSVLFVILIQLFARQVLIFIPAILLLPRYLGMTGVWLSLPISDVWGFISCGIWIWLEYRRQKKSGLWRESSTQQSTQQTL
jgi:Na+-driven multidrug efflux pump